MPRIFINLEAGCLQVNLMSTSAQINQLKYTILYYTIACLNRGLTNHHTGSHRTTSDLTNHHTRPHPTILYAYT